MWYKIHKHGYAQPIFEWNKIRFHWSSEIISQKQKRLDCKNVKGECIFAVVVDVTSMEKEDFEEEHDGRGEQRGRGKSDKPGEDYVPEDHPVHTSAGLYRTDSNDTSHLKSVRLYQNYLKNISASYWNFNLPTYLSFQPKVKVAFFSEFNKPFNNLNTYEAVCRGYRYAEFGRDKNGKSGSKFNREATKTLLTFDL